ncbi:MAG: hypothetical protein FJW20_05420 [Acidimicrobiia bacterium]|nr:hypothetical protein [Acidimicrobiia bacterium]
MMRLATILLVVSSAWPGLAAEPVELVREAALGWTQGAVKQDSAALQRFLTDDLQHPQFTTPNTNPVSTAFGTVTGEFARPRVIQFGLKLLF